jgi:hypothetical protein
LLIELHLIDDDRITQNEAIALPHQAHVTQNCAIATSNDDDDNQNEAIALPGEDYVTENCVIVAASEDYVTENFDFSHLK